MSDYDDRPRPGPGPSRVDNGLRAPTYVPLTNVDPDVGQLLLTALGRARIAAYLAPGDAPADGLGGAAAGPVEPGARQRLYVASEERGDARTIVAAAVRALGDGALDTAAADERSASSGAGAPVDPLAGMDTDAAFRALIADWHVDTHNAIRHAERDLTREDADWRARLIKAPVEDPEWLDDDHYVPPPPPPLPRLSGPTVLAIVVLVASIALLGLGATLGLAGNLGFVLGIVGILLSGGILLTRIGDNRRDEDDDGAAI